MYKGGGSSAIYNRAATSPIFDETVACTWLTFFGYRLAE